MKSWQEIHDKAYAEWKDVGGLSKFEPWFVNWLEDNYNAPTEKNEITLEDYIRENDPNTVTKLEKQLEIFKIIKTDPQLLIGKTVIAIRSGFSCGSGGGTVMIVDKIDSKGYVSLISPPNTEKSSWGSNLKELPASVVLY